MKNIIRLGTRAAILSAAFVVLCMPFAAQSASAQSHDLMNTTCEVTRLTDNDSDDFYPQIGDGLVVWTNVSGLFMWNGNSITRFSSDGFPLSEFGPEAPYQVDGGQVVWLEHNQSWAETELFFWDGASKTRLTYNDTSDLEPQIDGGQIIWTGHDGSDREIYFWENGVTTRLTDNTFEDYAGDINENSVVWLTYNAYTHVHEIYFWDGQLTSQLTDGVPHVMAFPRVDGINKYVVWSGFDGHDEEIYLWNGLTTLQLTDNLVPDTRPEIDRGQVVWTQYDDNGAEIYFWENGVTTQLTDNSFLDQEPLIDNGQVAWLTDELNPEGTASESIIHLWDKGVTTQVTRTTDWLSLPQIDGGQIVWAQYDGTDYEVYFADCNPEPPVANAGTDQVVTDADFNGQESVMLDASQSSDSDGTITSYQWSSDTAVVIPDGVAPTASFPIGVHHITLTVTDNDGLSDTDTVTVSVQGNTKPSNLTVSGELNLAPVLPTLHWDQMSNPALTPTYRIIMQRNGASFLNTTFSTDSVCSGASCAVSLADLLPAWGMRSGNYQWWVGALHANGSRAWSDAATFSVGVPPAAVPNPITVTTSGQIVVHFPDDPNTFWVQLVIAGHPTNKYNQWHGRDTGSRPFSCDGTTCTIALDWNPTGRNAQGNLFNFTAWMQAWGPGGMSSGWNSSAPFNLPGAAVPNPITVDPGDGRIAVMFPNDPNTFWAQLVIAGHPSKKYNQWHGRNTGARPYTCDTTSCVIYPDWNAAGEDAQGNPYNLKVWMRAWGLGGMSNGWNSSDAFILPQDAPVPPTNVTQAGGTAAEPGFAWTGQPGSTWYHVLLRVKGTETTVHSSWHLNQNIGCAGALAEPDDYTCAVGNLGLAGTLTAGVDYDIFVQAWGPGGMGAFGQGTPFTYNP